MTLNVLILASDHRGFLLKSLLSARSVQQGYAVIDCGADAENSCDAGDFAQKLAEELKAFPNRLGVLICGSGQAMAMTANRYQILNFIFNRFLKR